MILRKFVKDDWKDFNNYNLKADNCYPYLRYAEVLMTYVEAKNEMGVEFVEDVDKDAFREATKGMIEDYCERYPGVAELLDIIESVK